MSPAPTWAAKRDSVEPEVIAVFQEAGWSVVPLNGRGIPDLLLGPPGQRPILVEVKTGNAKLSRDQVEWHRRWRGERVAIVRSAAHARKLVRMLRPGPVSWEDAHEQAEGGRKPMRHVYVAGPYTADDHEGVELNVARAIQAGNLLLDAGLFPYVPHLSHFQHAAKARGYEEWMALDFAWLRKCEALLRLSGKSSGADREVRLAGEIGIPVFHSVEEAIAWARA